MWVWLTVVRDRNNQVLDVQAPINMDQVFMIEEWELGSALHITGGVIIHVKESRHRVLHMIGVGPSPLPMPAVDIF